jgi:hypothetical protein
MLIKNMVYHAQLCSASSLHLTSILPNIKPILANIKAKIVMQDVKLAIIGRISIRMTLTQIGRLCSCKN